MGGLDLSVIFFGLASAVSWGAGDFSGGVASKRASAYSVVVISQFVSLVLLILSAILIPEGTSSVQDMLIGGLAGICGVAGLVALYTGLARGPMGLVAPVTAVVAAMVPVLFSLFTEGFPAWKLMIGFIFGLVAVWLISKNDKGTKVQLADIRLPVFAGIGFGIFFVLIDQVSDNAILWPLVSARCASIIAMLAIGLLTRNFKGPVLKLLPIIVIAGIFDTSGNVFFALATRFGRLDIAAILGSLYPAVTVLLAWIVLNERLSRRQWMGVLFALIALILIAI
jgi:drug/metabolite transporter (DMT)-like permease